MEGQWCSDQVACKSANRGSNGSKLLGIQIRLHIRWILITYLTWTGMWQELITNIFIFINIIYLLISLIINNTPNVHQVTQSRWILWSIVVTPRLWQALFNFSWWCHSGAADLNRFTRWWCAMTVHSCGWDAHPLPFTTLRLSSAIFVWPNRCSLLCLCLHISHSMVCPFFFVPHPCIKLQTITLRSLHPYQPTAAMLVSVSCKGKRWNQKVYSMETARR